MESKLWIRGLAIISLVWSCSMLAVVAAEAPNSKEMMLLASTATAKTEQSMRTAVEGELRVNGKSVKLKHIYALKLKASSFYPKQHDDKQSEEASDVDIVELVITNEAI